MTFVLVVLVLAMECTRHRVICPHHIHTRHGVVRLGCTHFSSFIIVVLVFIRHVRRRHAGHIVCSYRVHPHHGTYSPWSRSFSSSHCSHYHPSSHRHLRPRHLVTTFVFVVLILVICSCLIHPRYVPFFKHENVLVCQEFFTRPHQLRKLSKPDSLDMLPRLLPSPPVPVWDMPVTPSFGFQLLLPPSTTDLSVVTGVEVVSLAIDATASVGVTFGVERIARHIVRRFDMWGLRWVRAAAARQGGVESRTDVDSMEILETFGFTQSEFDHNYITWEIDPSYPLGRESNTYHVIDILTHAYQPNVLRVDSLSVGGANPILKPKEGPTVTWTLSYVLQMPFAFWGPHAVWAMHLWEAGSSVSTNFNDSVAQWFRAPAI